VVGDFLLQRPKTGKPGRPWARAALGLKSVGAFGELGRACLRLFAGFLGGPIDSKHSQDSLWRSHRNSTSCFPVGPVSWTPATVSVVR